jgi:DNA-binding HxlR family transcriptional regulator
MGVRYARAALGVEPDKLGHAPRLVLVAMALRVLDKSSDEDAVGVYFGGRNRLLGDRAMMPNRTTYRTLTAHLATLERLGLIRRTSDARSGSQAVYRLLFPVDNSPP